MSEPPIAVATVFAGYPPAAQADLMAIRALIFAMADETGAGALTESLKWGEPAYLTEATGSGSTIRIAWKPAAPDRVGLYFNCKTSLVDTFRASFDELAYDGNRAILLPLGAPLPRDQLASCIAMALTYHRKAKAA